MDNLNFHDELQKEIEVNINKERETYFETEKLKQAISAVNEEILNYISKRKELSDYILEYRKNMLDEYKDDEDKVTEYFDHEKFIREESFKTMDKRLKELTILKNTPYFGRIDFRDEDIDGIQSIYVGRFGVTPEGSYEPLIVDWRAPAASLFYTGKLGKAVYKAPMGNIDVDVLLKRQFVIKKGKLVGLFDSAVDVKDDILQVVLSGNANSKLKDIIMTIQEEQDNLIRQPRNKTIVVDGVAGSGKTTIALHRVAYLLYNYREVLQDKVLILGPNSIFMEYISSVLPSLGEVGVKQTTFNELATGILKLDGLMSFKEYIEKVLNNDSEFIKNILYKTSDEFIKKLDETLEDLEVNAFKCKDIKYREKIVLTKDEVLDMFKLHYKDMPLFRRSKKIKRIIISKLKDYRDELVRNIQSEYKEQMSKLSKEDRQIYLNSLNYNRKIKIREVIRDLVEVRKSLIWIENPQCIDIYKQINGEKELILDDLAPILYLKIKLEGFKIMEEIKHVVIDEAQDLSKIQYIVIKELTKCSSLTVVGDSNQRILPIQGNVPMSELESIYPEMNVEHFKLNKSYRSTKEIMTYANKYLNNQTDKIVPLVRNGFEVKEENFKDKNELIEKIKENLNELQSKGLESIAIVCRDLNRTEEIGKLLKNNFYVKVIDNEDIIYNNEGIIVIPSYFAKGLEFDAVVIIDENTDEHKEQDKLMYIMATRALHELITYKVSSKK